MNYRNEQQFTLIVVLIKHKYIIMNELTNNGVIILICKSFKIKELNIKKL